MILLFIKKSLNIFLFYIIPREQTYVGFGVFIKLYIALIMIWRKVQKLKICYLSVS